MPRLRDTEASGWGLEHHMDEVFISDQPKRLMATPVTSVPNSASTPYYTAANLSYHNSVASYASSQSTNSRSSSIYSRASSSTASSVQQTKSMVDQRHSSNLACHAPNTYDNEHELRVLRQHPDGTESLRLSLQHTRLDQTQPVEPYSWGFPSHMQSRVSHPPRTQPHFVIAAFGQTRHGKANLLRLFFRDKADASQGNQLCERSRIWRVNDMSAMLTVVQLPDELVEEEQQTANIRYLNGLLGNRLGITTILAMTSIESRLANIFELLDGILMSLPNKQHMTSWWDRLVLVFNQGENRLDRVMQQRETMVNHILPDIQRRYGLSRAPSIVFVSTKTYEEMQQRSNISAEQYRTTCQQMLWRIVSGHSTQGWWRGDAVVPEEARSTDASIGSDSSDDDINGMVVMLGPKQDKRKQTSTPIKRRFTKRWVATPSHHGP